MTVTAIAHAVSSGQTSAESAARACLARVAAYDGVQPQAWISRFTPDQVLAAARAVDARIAVGEVLPLAGVPFDVIPGISAAQGAGAYAGIPLTHRDRAQSVRFVTAHAKAEDDGLDWAGFAREKQTLAFYMGVSGLERVRARLLAHGRSASTPCALVENGSRPEQRVVVGTLEDLPALARRHDVRSPALLFVGEVAALAAQLHWFGAAPLGASVERAVEPPTPALAEAA